MRLKDTTFFENKEQEEFDAFVEKHQKEAPSKPVKEETDEDYDDIQDDAYLNDPSAAENQKNSDEN